MLRCVCLFVLLRLCVLGQADVPTSQPVWGETDAPTVPPTTRGSSSVVMEISTTPEPYVSSDATSQPALDSIDATEPNSRIVASTSPHTPQPTSSTAAPPTPRSTSSTAAPPTNSTTPQPTNSTTPQPTNSTTPQPTNSTTPQPTNSTTAPLTPAPTTPSLPKVGDYVVRSERNSSACLMAKMGLQFSFRKGDSFQAINLDPNETLISGTCGNNGSDATLTLISDTITVEFIFTKQTSTFFLSTLNVTVVVESGPPFTAVNLNLSLWEASLGSSYLCKKEQSFNITDALILNTFELQVQPFGVVNDQFSTAHECLVDDASLLIPIIVGAALAVLILIVVIAYVIGRRKTYVGYQTL